MPKLKKGEPRRNIKEQVYFTPLTYALLILMIKSNPRYLSNKGVKVTLLMHDILCDVLKVKGYTQEQIAALIMKAAKQEDEYIQMLAREGEYNTRKGRLSEFLEE